jgi:hypothetical protein
MRDPRPLAKIESLMELEVAADAYPMKTSFPRVVPTLWISASRFVTPPPPLHDL